MLRSLARIVLIVAFGSATAQPTSPSSDGVDCRMLARMMRALETPGGARPGDERMTSGQNAADVKTMKVAGVSAFTASGAPPPTRSTS
jgi:hypothetical protein